MMPRALDRARAFGDGSMVSIAVSTPMRAAATTNGAARPKYWAMNPANAGPAMLPSPETVTVPASADSSREAFASQASAAVHTTP